MATIENGIGKVEASILHNPKNNTNEIILSIVGEYPQGSYETIIGKIIIKDLVTKPISHLVNTADGVPGSYGYIDLDLSSSVLELGRRSSPLRRINLHRKGLGCQYLNHDTRLWVDLERRLGPSTGWEKPVNRWRPVER